MILASDVIFELKKYVAFFEENYVALTASKYRRSWRYIDDFKTFIENSFLAGKPVFVIEPEFDGTAECFLFDYSNIIKVGVTEDNYDDFMNKINIERYDIKTLNKAQMQEILKNNALALNAVTKIKKQIEMRKNIDKMF